ncbi:MAG: uracil-DNA glycosylase [Gammaproteobacteria bacterium]|nr:uracil-DNA glycosylase [Gammaproteobacteria bacterium]
MSNIDSIIKHSHIHTQWQPLLVEALNELDPGYISELVTDHNWLPGIDNLFAAFRRDLKNVKYVLIGESPYPRKESANGIAFFDAAVGPLWSDNGLSKAVNRATSMRNILKTALLAEGHLDADGEGKISQKNIANIDKGSLIQTMEELFSSLHSRGFLMLNATPVLHLERKPAKEALYWRPFLERIIELIADYLDRQAILILWGKIAETIEAFPVSRSYQKLKCEHPYNISFIHNPLMQSLFAELKLLQR